MKSLKCSGSESVHWYTRAAVSCPEIEVPDYDLISACIQTFGSHQQRHCIFAPPRVGTSSTAYHAPQDFTVHLITIFSQHLPNSSQHISRLN